MNNSAFTVTKLLERVESESQIADGRTVRLCRDPNGSYWVVDDAERVVPLNQFAAECRSAARHFAAMERGEFLRRIAGWTKSAVARVAKVLRAGAKPAHA